MEMIVWQWGRRPKLVGDDVDSVEFGGGGGRRVGEDWDDGGDDPVLVVVGRLAEFSLAGPAAGVVARVTARGRVDAFRVGCVDWFRMMPVCGEWVVHVGDPRCTA